MHTGLHLRPSRPGDEDFLRRVYASTRAQELAHFGWDAATADTFLRMQFDAQDRHYRQHFPQARYDIVEQDGEPVGRLYVARERDEIRVIDIALLGAWRGRGIGGTLLGALQDEAAGASQRIVLQVELSNPAFTLYQRLGFRELEIHGLYRLMEWRAPASASTPQETT